MDVYPAIEPFDAGMLSVSDGNEIYWEVSGNRRGTAALYLHGGPGSGLGSGNYRRHFDPERYLIIGIDQRGCGRSRPLASEALRHLHLNTTQRLIEDMEAIRRHLRIKTWVVTGVSWGTTLALAYAQAHPDKVSKLVLVAVTTTSREEVDWITETVGRIFPEAWQRFEQGAKRQQSERVVAAYARRLASGSLQDRLIASQAWNEWEATHVSLDPNWAPAVQALGEERDLNFATLVTHYWSNDGFLRDGRDVLGSTARLIHIPSELIHGRYDISGPVTIPWRLHQRWPGSRLHIIESEGHGGPKSMEQMRKALDSFAGSRV